MSMDFWAELERWNTEGRWVDLTREAHEDTPHFQLFPALSREEIFGLAKDGFKADVFTLIGQYGTHADMPLHFIEGGRTVEQFELSEMVMPLVVIDAADKCRENPDYALGESDIVEWEAEHGRIPEGAFVGFHSGWCDRHTQEELDNRDAEGATHYPGWGMDALEFLVEQRNIGAIGHESCDTDPSHITATIGFVGETYILEKDRFQIEMMGDLSQCPAKGSVIFCAVPRIKGATGFTSRCFALCPR